MDQGKAIKPPLQTETPALNFHKQGKQAEEEKRSSVNLDIKEIEMRSMLEGIYTKKLVFKDDINAFLNSLTEEEFSLYMQHRQHNDENIWDTGRENVINLYLKSENKAETMQQLELDKMHEEERLREHLESIESNLRTNMNVFEAISFQDFYNLFDTECFDEFPLFVKLFFLRELMQYNSLYENSAFKMMTLYLT